MSKITDSARMQDCTIRFPGICSFNPEETVFAHISGVRFGHGTAIKTKFGAYACARCHDLVDSRLTRPSEVTRQDVLMAHYEGTFETMILLNKKRLITL